MRNDTIYLDDFLQVSKIRKIKEDGHGYGDEYWLVVFSTKLKIRITQGLEWGKVLVHRKTGVAKYIGEGPS